MINPKKLTVVGTGAVLLSSLLLSGCQTTENVYIGQPTQQTTQQTHNAALENQASLNNCQQIVANCSAGDKSQDVAVKNAKTQLSVLHQYYDQIITTVGDKPLSPETTQTLQDVQSTLPVAEEDVAGLELAPPDQVPVKEALVDAALDTVQKQLDDAAKGVQDELKVTLPPNTDLQSPLKDQTVAVNALCSDSLAVKAKVNALQHQIAVAADVKAKLSAEAQAALNGLNARLGILVNLCHLRVDATTNLASQLHLDAGLGAALNDAQVSLSDVQTKVGAGLGADAVAGLKLDSAGKIQDLLHVSVPVLDTNVVVPKVTVPAVDVHSVTNVTGDAKIVVPTSSSVVSHSTPTPAPTGSTGSTNPVTPILNVVVPSVPVLPSTNVTGSVTGTVNGVVNGLVK